MRFFSFFGTFAHKVAQTWFVLYETWYTTLFGIHNSVEVVRFENNSHMLEITCHVAMLCVFKLFGTFAHKVAEPWLFFLHETWQTTLFSISYSVEVDRIENHCHMLEITC